MLCVNQQSFGMTKKNKHIEVYDKFSEHHGYQQWVHVDIWFRGCYKHGLEIGYQEWTKSSFIGDSKTIVEFYIR